MKTKTIAASCWAIMSVAGVGAACSDLVSDSALENARRSPEALAEAALEALGQRDEDALAALMISREEYETLIWPSLPDHEHMPFAFVWSVTGPRSRKARRLAMEDYGGTPMSVVRVDLGGDVEPYDDFVLYREARMTVRRKDTGEEGVLPLMDVIVEMGGGWKFMSYKEH